MADARKEELDLQMAEERTRMSALRTRDAAERTLMAWIRTALAMIAFGFSVFKLFQFMAEEHPEAHHDLRTTRILTTALMGLGTVLLFGAILQYRSTLRELQREFAIERKFPLALWAAVLMTLIGAYGVGSALLHVTRM
ncbi:MAG TPA: DUF202 domain-containing protein [Flavobacteriales bacterium]|jgi:putative membrane protein|nr:DUF202 domain-containing protein [Flavobacteriales bacterium]